MQGVLQELGEPAERAGGIWDQAESPLAESVLKAIEQEQPSSVIFNICLLTFTVLSSLQERQCSKLLEPLSVAAAPLID